MLIAVAVARVRSAPRRFVRTSDAVGMGEPSSRRGTGSAASITADTWQQIIAARLRQVGGGCPTLSPGTSMSFAMARLSMRSCDAYGGCSAIWALSSRKGLSALAELSRRPSHQRASASLEVLHPCSRRQAARFAVARWLPWMPDAERRLAADCQSRRSVPYAPSLGRGWLSPSAPINPSTASDCVQVGGAEQSRAASPSRLDKSDQCSIISADDLEASQLAAWRRQALRPAP